ncbi:hypothetical protein ACIRU8_45560 [Streptomyces sp. NPDC101175]|uniref:hypothetical protein n=1 Tax=Streptomyces sp. NPDC101175 TaxID=3366123 RepID=UPI003834546D
MTRNKLVQAGTSRLQKAADSKVDPAVPAELQASAAQAGAVVAQPSAFAGGRVLSADDVIGTPEEQLAYVTEQLREIDALGRRAEDFTILNKGALLEVAQGRNLHTVAGYSNFGVWAGDVLDVEPKYVFELLTDARRIRALSPLGEDASQYLTRASARKVMADVVEQQGIDAAQIVLAEGVARAVKEGKRRPTAALLSQLAATLAAPTAPQIPEQSSGSEISDLTSSAGSEISDPGAAALAALERATTLLRERVYGALAPASVTAAGGADADALREQLAELTSELVRVNKRLSAAQRKVS